MADVFIWLKIGGEAPDDLVLPAAEAGLVLDLALVGVLVPAVVQGVILEAAQSLEDVPRANLLLAPNHGQDPSKFLN